MQDLRLAIRALRATPIVTGVAVLSLALGIGANTAIFSFVNSLLLRSLPVPAPERLALVSTATAATYRPPYGYAAVDQIRQRHLFEGVGAFTTCCSTSALTFAGDTASVNRQFFSGDFFDTLGVRAQIGRLFTPADDVTGGGPDGQVVVISDRLWKQRFEGASSVIGAPLRIDHASLTIIGVLPPDFLGLEVGRAFDIAMPLHTILDPGADAGSDVDVPFLNVLVRLKPGQTFDAATAALRAAQPHIRAAAMPKPFNAAFLKDPFTLESIVSGTSALRQRFERPLLLIFIVVALVLVIACANIANLLLARCIARRHDQSVRVALGASRWQVARPFLIESLVLSAIGTAAGIVFATWAARALVAQLSTSTTQIVLNVSLDWRVMAFSAATLIATALLFGVAPSLRATRVAPIDALKDRTAAAGSEQRTGSSGVADGLIVAQVTLSLALVVAAGLFVRTFEQLARVPLGFDRDHVLGVTVNAQAVPGPARNALYHQLARAAAAVPGVAGAGGSINPPLVGFLVGDFVVSVPGVPPPSEAERISQANSITPGYLQAYGTTVRGGRDFDDRDTQDSPPVMLVNEAFATRFVPDRNAVGTALALTARLLSIGDIPVGVKTIVGVVDNAVYRSVREPAQPTIYLPLAQFGANGGTTSEDSLPYVNFFLAVRTSTASPALLSRSVAAALTAVNASVTPTFRTLADQVDDTLAQDRLIAMLSGSFAGVALLLAGLGLYGVTAYAIAQRRAEIGIRMALGAAPAMIVSVVLSRVSRLVGLGVVIGTVVSLWASRFVATLLYGVEPRDPATLIGAAVVLATVAGLAGWIPALRASRIDPADVLRES
jgi:putative ABC transport system permease protein